MFRALRAWWTRRERSGDGAEDSPALDTPEKQADLVKLIQSGQANLPGRPQ
jgi:hypothetical protein